MPRGIETRPPTPEGCVGFLYCVICQNWYPPDDLAMNFGNDFWEKRPYLMGFCRVCWDAAHPSHNPVTSDDELFY